MCRIEERVYIRADGHRSKFEDHYPCDKSRGGNLCSRVKRKTSEYHTKNGPHSRDDTPSPINPLTPTGTGTYVVQQRRPSSTGVRPSTRDGSKPIAPEIIINFGPRLDKGKKSAPTTTPAKHSKRASLGASSIGSNDAAVDSPGSDASQTIRTGFPDAPLPPSAFGHTDHYLSTPTTSHGFFYPQTSSMSSLSGSSQPSSLYVTSDPDREMLDSRRTSRYPPTIVQHQPPVMPSSFTSRGQPDRSSASYRTAVRAPQAYTQDTHTPDGLFPLDYGELADRSASSHASSGVPDITRRGKDRDESRRKKEEARKLQEASDRHLAEELAKAENLKQVRFELGRQEARAKERAEKAFAEKEKLKAEDREDARWQKKKELEKRERDELATKERRKEQDRRERDELAVKERRKEQEKRDRDEQAAKERRKEQERRDRDEQAVKERKREQEKRDRDEQAAKERRRERSKPTTGESTSKRPTGSRRMSMTQGEMEVQRQLLLAENMHMQSEREAADARDREEKSALLRQQQEASAYYDPRGGDRSLARRDSVALPPITTGLSRSDSKRRASIIQANPPVPASPGFSTRPSTTRQQSGPPVSFPSNFNRDYARPVSARRPSFTQENPFAASTRRGSNAGLDRPYVPAPSMPTPTAPSQDPWDLRATQDALPSPHQPRDSRYPLQSRGEATVGRSNSIRQAQQATRAMRNAAQYDSVFDDDSDEIHSPRLRRK